MNIYNVFSYFAGNSQPESEISEDELVQMNEVIVEEKELDENFVQSVDDLFVQEPEKNPKLDLIKEQISNIADTARQHLAEMPVDIHPEEFVSSEFDKNDIQLEDVKSVVVDVKDFVSKKFSHIVDTAKQQLADIPVDIHPDDAVFNEKEDAVYEEKNEKEAAAFRNLISDVKGFVQNKITEVGNKIDSEIKRIDLDHEEIGAEIRQEQKIVTNYVIDPISGIAMPKDIHPMKVLEERKVALEELNAKRNAVVVDPAVVNLQDAVLRVGFPNAGAIPGLLGLGPLDIQIGINDQKDKAIDAIEKGEKAIQASPLSKIKLVNKSQSGFMKFIRSIVKFVSKIFHKIGVFFGLCKPKTQIEVKLESDKRALKTKNKERQAVLKKTYDLYSLRECKRIRLNSLLVTLEQTENHRKEMVNLEKEIGDLNFKIRELRTSDAFKELNVEMQRILGQEKFDMIKEFKESSSLIRNYLNDTKSVMTNRDFEVAYEDAFYKFSDPFTRQYRKEIHALEKNAKIEALGFKAKQDELFAAYNNEMDAIDQDPSIVDKLKALDEVEANYIAKRDELQSVYNKLNAEFEVKEDIENSDDIVRDFVDFALYNIPIVRTIAGIFPSIINKASHIVSSGLINNSLKGLRDYVFGKENRQRVKVILDNVQKDVVKDLTDNLNIINQVYHGNLKTENESSNAYNVAIQNKALEKLRASDKGWKGELLNQAVPVLTDLEAGLLLRGVSLVESSTPIIQKAIADRKALTLELIKQVEAKYKPRADSLAKKIEEDKIHLENDLDTYKSKIRDFMKRKDLGVLTEDELYQEYRELNASFDPQDELVQHINQTLEANLKRDIRLEVEKLQKDESEAIAKLKASQTPESAILARKANIKVLEAKIKNAAAGDLLSIGLWNNEIARDQQTIVSLQDLKAAMKKVADGENQYLDSIATLIQDHILFPQGVPSDLKGLLKVTGQSTFFKDQIKQQLGEVIRLIDNPQALRNFSAGKLNELLKPEDQSNDLGNIIKVLIENQIKANLADKNNLFANILNKFADNDQLLKELDKKIGYRDAVDLYVNRVDATRVNKYLFFSALYSAVDGAAASFNKKIELTDGKILIKG